MNNTRIWKKETARGLLARNAVCGVEGCAARPAIAVAGDGSSTTFMCLRHAAAWSDSSLCRDVAQHNSGASRLALSTWLNVAGAGALATEWS